METAILKILTNQLIKVLMDSLPNISTSWWESLVVDQLTFQQRAQAKQNNLRSLEQLDLAALLRVVDQNWYKLSQRKRSQISPWWRVGEFVLLTRAIRGFIG